MDEEGFVFTPVPLGQAVRHGRVLIGLAIRCDDGQWLPVAAGGVVLTEAPSLADAARELRWYITGDRTS